MLQVLTPAHIGTSCSSISHSIAYERLGRGVTENSYWESATNCGKRTLGTVVVSPEAAAAAGPLELEAVPGAAAAVAEAAAAATAAAGGAQRGAVAPAAGAGDSEGGDVAADGGDVWIEAMDEDDEGGRGARRGSRGHHAAAPPAARAAAPPAVTIGQAAWRCGLVHICAFLSSCGGPAIS